MPWKRPILGCVLTTLLAAPLQAQTIEDGLLMERHEFCTGFMYMRDSWSDYWEGTLKRENANVGTVTTQSVGWMGTFGVTNSLNLIAMLPWVSTRASGGTLQGQSGLQDLTVAAKYRFLQANFGEGAHTIKGFLVGSYGTPVSDYVPDLLPLSIGLHSQRFSGRLTANYTTRSGLYTNATGAYTWRSNVTLDRPAYYTDGTLFLTDQVDMPNAFDYALTVGYLKGGLLIPVSFTQQRTLGGGDIRRQDMPFVSNRMNASRIDTMIIYYPAKLRNLSVRLGATRTLNGRNVGESTTFAAGLMYVFNASDGGPRVP